MIRHLLVAHDLTPGSRRRPRPRRPTGPPARCAGQPAARVRPGAIGVSGEDRQRHAAAQAQGGRPRRGQRHPPVQGPADRRHPAADPGARTGPVADGRTPPEDLRTLRQHHPRPGGAAQPGAGAARRARGGRTLPPGAQRPGLSQCACTALRQAYRLLPVEADLHALHVFESPTTACSACPGRMPRTWPPRPG